MLIIIKFWPNRNHTIIIQKYWNAQFSSEGYHCNVCYVITKLLGPFYHWIWWNYAPVLLCKVFVCNARIWKSHSLQHLDIFLYEYLVIFCAMISYFCGTCVSNLCLLCKPKCMIIESVSGPQITNMWKNVIFTTTVNFTILYTEYHVKHFLQCVKVAVFVFVPTLFNSYICGILFIISFSPLMHILNGFLGSSVTNYGFSRRVLHSTYALISIVNIKRKCPVLVGVCKPNHSRFF